ncbi:MAG TPA: hypothetical protein VF695_13085, partial [Sphingomonas sp.]
MAKDARQPIAGWRNEVLPLPIRVVGIDLTGKAMRMQVRLAPGTPGAALLNLETVTNGNAEGIRLTGVTTTNGVPTSNLVLRINKSSMQGLPFSGELGAATPLAYAMQLDGITRLYGEFFALDHAIDSDNNPANRIASYGGAGFRGGVADGITLTIGDGGVTVEIDGASELAEILGAAQAIVTAATQQATIATTGANTAIAQALIATAKAAQSTTDAQTADTAKAAVLAATSGIPSNAVLTMQAATRAILREFTGMAAGAQAYLGETGREGAFIWRVGDYAARVASDPDEGLYVKATAVAATAGCWERVVGDLTYYAAWWGIIAGFVDTQITAPVDGGTQGMVNAPQSRTFYYMMNLLPSGATLVLPASPETTPIKVAALVHCNQKSIHIRAKKGGTWVSGIGVARNGGSGLFRLNGSHSSVKG